MGQVVKVGGGDPRPPQKKAGSTSEGGSGKLLLAGGGVALAVLALGATIYFVNANDANSGKSALEQRAGGQAVYRSRREMDNASRAPMPAGIPSLDPRQANASGDDDAPMPGTPPPGAYSGAP